MKKKYSIPLTIAIILFLAYQLLFMAPSIPDTSNYKIHLSKMRKMTQDRHDLPLRINSLLIAKTTFPAKAIVASASPFQNLGMVFSSFQIVYPKHKTIILDTALDSRLYQDMYRRDDVIKAHFQKLQAALLKADQILITHEHLDHIGGIAQSPYLEDLYPKTRLSAEQLSGPTIKDAKFPAGSLEKFDPLRYEGLYTPAPGIVLLKAPGHSVGSQLIYVRLQNGGEYLFVGDVAWHKDNITQLVGRPWIMSTLLTEDRTAVAHQLRALHDLQIAETTLHLVVAHDLSEYDRQIKAGLYGSGFE